MGDNKERFTRQPAEGGREVVEKELERKQEKARPSSPSNTPKEGSQPEGGEDEK